MVTFSILQMLSPKRHFTSKTNFWNFSGEKFIGSLSNRHFSSKTTFWCLPTWKFYRPSLKTTFWPENELSCLLHLKNLQDAFKNNIFSQKRTFECLKVFQSFQVSLLIVHVWAKSTFSIKRIYCHIFYFAKCSLKNAILPQKRTFGIFQVKNL